MKRAHLLVIVQVIAAAIVLSMASPIFDHHFAERQFGHAHLTPLQIVEHSHDLHQQPHTHPLPDEALPLDLSAVPTLNYSGDSTVTGIAIASVGVFA